MSVIGSRSAAVEELIHGVVVDDPYRWLEDRGLPETEEWIQEQRRCCDAYFAECEHLPEVRRRVRRYLDIDVVDQPAKVGNQYFYRRRASGQEQGSIYVREATTGTERLLVDPSGDGRFVSVGIHRISSDGAMLAYERKCGGEDKKSIHIIDVASGTNLDCSVKLGYSRGFAFSGDGSGFYYCQVFLDATADQTISFCRFDRSVPETVVFQVNRSRESRLVLIADSVHLGAIWLREVDGEMLKDFWMTRLNDRNHHWHLVFSEKPLSFKPILKAGRLFAVSYEGAENGKLVELNKSGEEIRTIIPQQELMLRQSLITEDRVFAVLQTGFNSSIQCWDHEGNKLPEMDFPPDGTVGFVPHLGDDSTIFVSYQSFAQPPVIFEYVPRCRSLRVWDKGQSCEAARPTKIRRTAYASVDGTSIPITLVGRELASNQTVPRPVIMTSYGGFGVPVTPQFSVLLTLLFECGVLLALPHIRGGGEFGAAWHEAATGRNRQVAFNDFLAGRGLALPYGYNDPYSACDLWRFELRSSGGSGYDAASRSLSGSLMHGTSLRYGAL